MSGGPRGILNARITVDQVPGSYRTAGGGVDATTRACGGSRWSQNEPAVAMDPRDPSVLAAGANEYCALITNPDAWAGYYRSTDGGRTWLDSLVPGYQADQTPDGSASPTHGLCESAGDPTMAFDPAGRLFYGFICFSRGKAVAGREREPVNGSTFVATYDRDGARYVRTVLVAKGTRASGIFEDKINLTVDQTAGPTSGNVYTAWAEFRRGGSGHGPPGAVILFARSTDHGATFSRPVAVTSGLLQEQFADLSVGPDGSVDVAYRNARAIWVSRSTDGGRSFGPPELVEALNEFDSEAFSGTTITRDCGDRPYACNTGFTFPRFESQPAVAADASGVHVVWTQELPAGQAKIFVKSSADGVDWPSTGRALDGWPLGHQFMPDIGSAGGVITVAFYDSRNDPAYAPHRPPGNTASGRSSGPAVDVYAARSTDGGRSWSEVRVSDVSSVVGYEITGQRRVPFWGDYLYVSAVPGRAAIAWTDGRDIVPGDDPRETGDDQDADGFDVFAPCADVPSDLGGTAEPTSPSAGDPCLRKGGLDQNIYAAVLPASDRR